MLNESPATLRRGANMELVTTADVNFSLAILEPEERRRVLDWFDRLKCWHTNEVLRGMARRLDYKNVYVLVTPDRTRIFFDPSETTVTIVDLASRDTVAAFSGKG